MRRIPAVFMAAFILSVVFGLAGWQTQQNFGTGLPVGLFFSPPTFTISTVGGGNGTLALAGNTSGTATLAAPAVAGTATNPLLISNSLQFPSGTALNWNNDVGFSRISAVVVAVGNGAAGNTTGLVKTAGLISGGTAAALTGTGACATFGAQTGGAMAGQSSCSGVTAASTLTITPGTTAPNGWICTVYDQTTRANLFQQTANAPTTCTLTATSVTQNDVFVYQAISF